MASTRGLVTGSILYADRYNPDGSLASEESFHYNAVGHVTGHTDASGAVTQSNAYDAFGQIVASDGSSENNRLANTKERDAIPGGGLDNHGYRYYDPATGRYITRDPLDSGGGYADGLNPFLHVHNNPVNHLDPLGLMGQGHHRVPQDSYRQDGKLIYPKKQKTAAIYDEFRLTSPAYATRSDGAGGYVDPTHNGKTLNGVSHGDYNKAVRDLSLLKLGDGSPGRLGPSDARKLVGMIQQIEANPESDLAQTGYGRKIAAFNAGVRAEITAANAAWSVKLGLPEASVPTEEQIKAYQADAKAKVEKARKASRAAEFGDAAKRLPSIVAPVLLIAAYKEFGWSGAVSTAYGMSPAGDAQDIAAGVPEIVEGLGELSDAGATIYSGASDTTRHLRELRSSQAMEVDSDAFDRHLDRRAGFDQEE